MYLPSWLSSHPYTIPFCPSPLFLFSYFVPNIFIAADSFCACLNIKHAYTFIFFTITFIPPWRFHHLPERFLLHTFCFSVTNTSFKCHSFWWLWFRRSWCFTFRKEFLQLCFCRATHCYFRLLDLYHFFPWFSCCLYQEMYIFSHILFINSSILLASVCSMQIFQQSKKVAKTSFFTFSLILRLNHVWKQVIHSLLAYYVFFIKKLREDKYTVCDQSMELGPTKY